MIWAMIVLMGLAFIQNVSFSLVSRSRNRNHMGYHLIAAVLANTTFFLTFRQLMVTEMAWSMIPAYVIGTVAGSLTGAWISMRIEQWLGALADPHTKENQ